MDQSGKKQNEPMVIEDEYPQKPVPQVEKVDYSGAHEKTDPKEIALVKKLDRWIMASSFPSLYSAGGVMRLQPRLTKTEQQPMLWSMYWLNYLDRNAIALARLNDLEEDLNLTSTRMLPAAFTIFIKFAKNNTKIISLRVSNLCLYSIRWLHHWSGPVQHVSHPHSPESLHGRYPDAPPISPIPLTYLNRE